MTLMIPQVKVEIDLPQTGILMLSRDPDALPRHNPCFYQGTDQPDMLPERLNKFQHNYQYLASNLTVTCNPKDSYLSSIMRNSKTSTRKLRFNEALVIFECRVQFLSKCFVC